MPKRKHAYPIVFDRWGTGRANRRGFPVGLLPRILRECYTGGRFLHVCCGEARIPQAVNLDIRPEVKPDVLGDGHRLPFRTATFAFVLCDPPYEQYDARALYGTDHVRLFTLLEELSRVTEPGGLYMMLYPYRPHRLQRDCVVYDVVVGGTEMQRPRVLSGWRRGFWPGKRQRQYLPKSERDEK